VWEVSRLSTQIIKKLIFTMFFLEDAVVFAERRASVCYKHQRLAKLAGFGREDGFSEYFVPLHEKLIGQRLSFDERQSLLM